MSFDDLERHVINWSVEQLAALQEYVYEIEDDVTFTEEKKFSLFSNLAKSVDDLLSLLVPLRHDSECLVEWAFNFIDAYGRTNYADHTPKG